jgi:hypothetical protein
MQKYVHLFAFKDACIYLFIIPLKGRGERLGGYFDV